ncbi:MAG: FIST C-terminal domain-containing protein, partial [Phycisphaerales bacterium]
MSGKTHLAKMLAVLLLFSICLSLLSGCAVSDTYVSPDAEEGGSITIRVASADKTDAFEAGRRAAAELREKMGQDPLQAVVLAECFEGRAEKKEVLKGVCSVLPETIVFGFSTYGSFAQEGCLDFDSVSLLGIAGDGIATSAVLQPKLGIANLTMEEDEAELAERLRAGGSALASRIFRREDDRLMVIMADAHSPKNQFLLDGAQEVLGKDFPITGGSANKNAGQTFVYFQGRMYADAAIALMLSGDFNVSLAGRQAKENAKVISSAAEGADEAMRNMKAIPFSVLAFNCAGRQGKLDNIEDELTAIQGVIGNEIPLFGAYCAGEIGPADIAEKDPDALS